MTETQIKFSGTGEGWTCANCGQWAPSGTQHICGVTNTSNGYPYYPCCACMAQVNNLIRKIDELLTKLEAKQP